eukprot:COSAG05_NODE_22661_length_263_cov_0.634146_1_plen_45_part_10
MLYGTQQSSTRQGAARRPGSLASMHSRGFFNVIDDEDEESAFPQL